MVNDAETQKLLHSPWSTMLKHRSCYMVDDAETQKLYTVHGHDAETQRKPLHSPGPMMLKHKGSHYTVRGQQQLTQITNHRCYMRNAETVKSANPVAETAYDLRCRNSMQQQQETVTPVVTTTPHSALVIAFCCGILGCPILV
jgi:hypothetical protein